MKKILFAMLLFVCIGCSKNDPENLDALSQILFNGSDYQLTEKNIPDWNGLGIYCILTNGNTQELKLSDNNGIVKDAEIELHSQGNLLGKFIFNESELLYTLQYTPQEGMEYTLKSSYKDKKIDAKAVMPKRVERKFVCNPILVPQTYRESIYLDKESEYYINEIADEDKFYLLFDKYPSYTFASNGKGAVAYTYFKKDEKIVDLLFSTHANTHDFNKADKNFTIEYPAMVSPDKIEGKPNREIVEADMYQKEAKYDYYRSFARIQLDDELVNPYYSASYVCSYAVSVNLCELEINYILDIIKNNPQYGCTEKMCEFWGPNFFVMPYTGKNLTSGTETDKNLRVDREADKQIVMSVSNELDIYLMNAQEFGFDNFADLKSNFTNVAGGYGIFGAAWVEEYDFTKYYEELRDAYFNIIGKLDNTPPLLYHGYEYGKFW